MNRIFLIVFSVQVLYLLDKRQKITYSNLMDYMKQSALLKKMTMRGFKDICDFTQMEK